MKTNLRVAFDSEAFLAQVRGGITRYYAELIRRLPVYGVTPELTVPLFWNEHLSACPGSFRGIALKPKRHTRMNAHLRSALGKLSDSAITWFGTHDVRHHTFYGREVDHRHPNVCTVVDMIPEIFPEQFPGMKPHRHKLEMVREVDLVLAISETTRRDLLRMVPNMRAEVVTIHLGVDREKFVSPEHDDVVPYRDYVLYIGNRSGYKNFDKLADAIAPLMASRPWLKLVCIGGGPLQEAELVPFRLASGGIVDRVIQTTPADEILPAFYRCARLVVSPSTYEGFGLPVIESFAAGTPVALSSCACFTEIADDAAAYFEPDDTNSIAATLEPLIDDEFRRLELVRRGQLRVQQFTWERTAELTALQYRKLLGKTS